jgi:hypothetical protein
MPNTVDAILFTLSVSLERVISAINAIQDGNVILCLSTHKLFENEIAEITSSTSKEVFFCSFYQFINEKEMIYCDEKADLVIVEMHGSRKGRIGDYYNKIKEIKNITVLNNIKNIYKINRGYLLSCDLGLCKEIWVEDGFEDISIPVKQIEFSKFRKYKNMMVKFYKATILSMLDGNNNRYIFFGTSKRVEQYLRKDCSFSYGPRLERITLSFLLLLLYTRTKIPVLSYIVDKIFSLSKYYYQRRYKNFFSSIHEYSGMYGELASSLGIEMVVIQDGLLPGNYTSKYLRYYTDVDHFLVWDNYSSKIFNNNDLQCVVSSLFDNKPIPLQLYQKKIGSVLFLASGSGDWTALKNRSDEDLIFISFVQAAKLMNDVNFVFRPHPLWEHPKHQGIGSIQRLAKYAESLSLSNLSISTGVQSDVQSACLTGSLSLKSDTINDEIENSDIVLADHSQTLFTAARMGKIIASVSVAERKEFFFDYTSLGFPILRSSIDLVDFINNSQQSTEFSVKYNDAIQLFNEGHMGIINR